MQPDKDLWVATTDGLHMENRGPVRWEQLHNPDKGGSDRINEILRTRDGTMWFATSRGAMVQPPGGGLVVIRDADGQPLDEVTGLAEDDLGRVWLSSGRRPMGAYCFDGKWHHFGRQQHLDALCFHKIRRDRRGNLWFLGLSDHPDEQRSDGTGAFMFDGKTFTHWGGSDGLPNDRVYGFCEGPDGARWFGTAAGLGCYRNGRWQTWTQSTGLRCDRVFALDVDALGGVWFAQSIFGLGHLDAGGNLQFFDSDDGLSASEVTDLRFDERGWLWIATPDGLNVLRDGHITALRHDVGLVFSDLWPVLPLADCVYVGSLGHGVQVLKLAALDQRAPQLAIKEAAWQEDTATLSWSARGPWGLPGEGRVLTRYRIDAEPWSRWSTTEAIHRGSVLAGKHQLEVEAKGAFGSVTAPVRKTFQAPLLPYLRPLFYAPIAVSLLIAVACATVLIRRQRRHLRERRALEEQLRQVQKMEAIGRLAGGIAHDFNNLLTAINGYSDLVLSMLPDGSTARESIEKIQRAGERAASLTAQLLAFSRKQIVCDRTINLNEIALDLVDMLRRLLGEDIELELDLAPDLGLVRADPGQVQQVLLNLTVNARDAMNQGGHLIVRTRNDERAVEVRLAVSDTGCGIAAEHRAHLFEPFYTTKELGKGTGLGLAMVYGIVQQSGGRITVDSEPGCGTTFTIHLPRVAAVKPSGQADPVAPSESHGGETVLIVEDEPDVRSLMRDTLACSGYRVLEATDGVHALEVARSHGETIHLLLTDVVMPRSSGPELARQLARVRPETRVLYVSGYTGDARLDHHGAGRIAFIQKPFRATELKRRVHEVLHAPAAALAKR
ncbi:MAG: ATP-binding protein [Planctomycetota bacterium]